MNVYEAIFNRQSIGKMKSDPVAREVIERLLAAGVQAPNHYKVRPWRFIVLTGAGRERIGQAMAESFRKKFPEAPEEALHKEAAKPLRAPVVIAVGVEKPTEPKVLEIENICAAAAACQNILLAAEGEGLAAIWRTGDAARDPLVKSFLGLEQDQDLIGFLYIGYAEILPELKIRPGFEDRTVWLD